MQSCSPVGLALVVALSTGCDRGGDKTRATPSARPSASALASAASRPSLEPAPKSSERDEPDAAVADKDAGALSAGELFDIGPAGPASASPIGVVMISKDDDVVVAALNDKGKLDPVALDGGAFSTFTRGPGVTASHAYWISKGRLVRRKLTGTAALETLAEDARDGTRASPVAGTDGRPDTIAYVARPTAANGDPVGMLWVEGQSPVRLSPEGAAASSVALAPFDKQLLAVFVEGRTGMSPVHARRVHFEQGKPVLDEDVVVWIGGGAQSLTEIAGGTSDQSEAWAFVPLERDATRFGLAEIRVGDRPKMGAPVTWRGYPNGMDPAPIATASACGRTLVAYARPADAKPGAPQELHLAPLGAEGLGSAEIIARSKSFSSVSIAPTKDGVLVSWVADHRTWASSVRCTTAKK